MTQQILDVMKSIDSITYAVTISLLKILGALTIVAVVGFLEHHLVAEIKEFINWKHHGPPPDPRQPQAPAPQPRQWTRPLALAALLTAIVVAGVLFATITSAHAKDKHRPAPPPAETEQVYL
jgi:hypothetical protein